MGLISSSTGRQSSLCFIFLPFSVICVATTIIFSFLQNKVVFIHYLHVVRKLLHVGDFVVLSVYNPFCKLSVCTTGYFCDT